MAPGPRGPRATTPTVSARMADRAPLTVEKAWAVLGVPKGASLEQVRQAYRGALLKAHPDKGGDRDAFCLTQVAWQLLQKVAPPQAASGAAQTRKRRRASIGANQAPTQAKKPRLSRTKVATASDQTHSRQPVRGSTRPAAQQGSLRLASLRSSFAAAQAEQAPSPAEASPEAWVGDGAHSSPCDAPWRKLLPKRRPGDPFVDPLAVWKCQAMAAAATAHEGFASPSSPLPSFFIAGKAPARGLLRERSKTTPRLSTAAGSLGAKARIRRRSGDNAKGSRPSSGGVAAALARHVRQESRRVESVDLARNALDRCPMLARHLRAETAAREAAVASAPESDVEAVAARVRAAPREERRSLLESLPKATRAALEQYLVAQRATAAGDAGSTCSTSAGTGDAPSELAQSLCSGSTSQGSEGRGGGISSCML